MVIATSFRASYFHLLLRCIHVFFNRHFKFYITLNQTLCVHAAHTHTFQFPCSLPFLLASEHVLLGLPPSAWLHWSHHQGNKSCFLDGLLVPSTPNTWAAPRPSIGFPCCHLERPEFCSDSTRVGHLLNHSWQVRDSGQQFELSLTTPIMLFLTGSWTGTLIFGSWLQYLWPS